jgi:hypothetical protein
MAGCERKATAMASLPQLIDGDIRHITLGGGTATGIPPAIGAHTPRPVPPRCHHSGLDRPVRAYGLPGWVLGAQTVSMAVAGDLAGYGGKCERVFGVPLAGKPEETPIVDAGMSVLYTPLGYFRGSGMMIPAFRGTARGVRPNRETSRRFGVGLDPGIV